MKRLIFGMVAIVTAAAFAAFTTPKVSHNKLLDSYFEFDELNYNPTIANVEDESKWVKVSDIGTCSNNMVKACRIKVTSTYVSGTNLLSTAAISALESSADVAYVSSAHALQIINKN